MEKVLKEVKAGDNIYEQVAEAVKLKNQINDLEAKLKPVLSNLEAKVPLGYDGFKFEVDSKYATLTRSEEFKYDLKETQPELLGRMQRVLGRDMTLSKEYVTVKWSKVLDIPEMVDFVKQRTAAVHLRVSIKPMSKKEPLG